MSNRVKHTDDTARVAAWAALWTKFNRLLGNESASEGGSA
jgi:hypothetical protein